MKDSKKVLIVGFIQWLGAGLGLVSAYLLTLDSFADWNWFHVSTGALGHIGAGLAALALFVKNNNSGGTEQTGGNEPFTVQNDADLYTGINLSPSSVRRAASTASIDMAKLRRELKTDEGYRDVIYIDTTGNKTAGIGHKLTEQDPEFVKDVGYSIPADRIEAWFSSDISKAIEDARSVVRDFDSHPQSVKHALVNMAFNLGRSRLRGFTRTLALINARRYPEAASEALNSLWAGQVGARANRVAAMISSGSPEIGLA